MNKPLITPRGPGSADIMFVMDHGTADDAASGLAFSGNYHLAIKSLCKENGINYESTYRTLYLKTVLDYGGKRVKEKREAISSARGERNYDEILKNEILQVRPRVIVPMGELVFNWVALQKGLSKFRGSILPIREDIQINANPNIIRVIPTLPPETIYAQPISRVYISLDYAKIQKNSQCVGPIQSDIFVWIADTVTKFQNYLQRIPEGDYGVFDIETRFNVPVCIGFSFSDSEGVCVPLVDENVSLAERGILWQMVDRLLRSTKWVNQNIKFDLLVLERYGFQINNILGDTALRQSIIYPELPKNLGFLNSIYNDIPYFKDEGKDPSSREQLYLYCAKDCVSTYQIYGKQDADIKDLGLHKFERSVQELFWPYIRIERRGLLIDQQRLLTLKVKYDNLYFTHRTVLERMIGEKTNPHSPTQVARLVYEDLKWPIRKDRKTGSYATDEETLEELLAFQRPLSRNPFSRTILDYIIGCRKLHKVIEYLETPIHPDGRLRGSYDLGGARTGRSACKSTTDYLIVRDGNQFTTTSIGRSLQTIGKHGFRISGIEYGRDLRSIFVPTPGYVYVEGDLSQAEARVDSVLAKDFDFLSLFDVAPGVHVKTGEWIFGYTIDKKKEPDKYHIAKTVRHAGERNMGPDRLAMMIQRPLKFCAEILVKFHNAEPNIKRVFHKDIREFVTNNRYLVSPHGRRRDFFGKLDNEMFNEAISQIPQATVSDQIKFSLPLLEEAAPYAHFVYEGHDALMCEIEKEKLEEYTKVFHKIVERPIPFQGCSLSRDFDLVIPAELSYSEETWEEMKPYEE